MFPPGDFPAPPGLTAADPEAAGLESPMLEPLSDAAAYPQQSGLSSAHWGAISFLSDPVCDGCGRPMVYAMTPDWRCVACQSAPLRTDRLRAACYYDAISRGPVLALKHGDRTDLVPMLSAWMSRAGAALRAEADALVPVPLHRWRLLARRYNQSAELARGVARLWAEEDRPVPVWAEALVRTRPTASQGGKSAVARKRNLAGAIAVHPAFAARIQGARLVLVDDVLTTGATLNACARALKAAGAAAVDALVLARVGQGVIDPGEIDPVDRPGI